MSAFQIHLFPCLSDNFGVLVHDPESGATVSIDAPQAEAVLKALEETGWTLSELWITHHHKDHTDGIADVKARTGARVIGPRPEAERIAGLDAQVGEGDTFAFAGREVRVIETPGHTAGHIAYWLPEEELAFVGDTLFALGCGRILEGTAEDMWGSLQKLAALPPETQIYCGHEYTLANGRFALNVDAGNVALKQRMAGVEQKVAAGKPTIPSTIAEELATNPFLRAGEPELAEAVGKSGAPAVEVFAELRERKNRG